MAQRALSQLPGENDLSLIVPEDVILSFSETKEEVKKRTGKQGAGRKLNYWRILRRDIQMGNIPLEDEELNARLRELTGQEQPTVIPCAVVGNPIPNPVDPGETTLDNSIIYRRFAWYAASGPVCACDQADALNRVAQQAVREQVKGRDGKSYPKVVGYKARPCLGKECPDYKKQDGCKLQVIVSLRLPWAGGIVAKYRTTGEASFRAMMASLLDISDMSGGWLHGLPLEFVFDETMSANYGRIPKVRFRPGKQVAARLLEEGQRLAQLNAGTARYRQLVEAARTDMVRFVENPVEQKQFQEEFHPGNTALPIIDVPYEPEPAPAPPTVQTIPQRLDADADAEPAAPVEEAPPAAPEEPQGEDYALQSPPVSPAAIMDLKSFNAAMLAIGADEDEIAHLKDVLGLNVKLREMTLENLRDLYKEALQDREALQ